MKWIKLILNVVVMDIVVHFITGLFCLEEEEDLAMAMVATVAMVVMVALEEEGSSLEQDSEVDMVVEEDFMGSNNFTNCITSYDFSLLNITFKTKLLSFFIPSSYVFTFH